jgi:hypothetical protein
MFRHGQFGKSYSLQMQSPVLTARRSLQAHSVDKQEGYQYAAYIAVDVPLNKVNLPSNQ